jgi:hypothetical protein
MPRRPQATFCPQIGAIIVALVTLFVACKKRICVGTRRAEEQFAEVAKE